MQGTGGECVGRGIEPPCTSGCLAETGKPGRLVILELELDCAPVPRWCRSMLGRLSIFNSLLNIFPYRGYKFVRNSGRQPRVGQCSFKTGRQASFLLFAFWVRFLLCFPFLHPSSLKIAALVLPVRKPFLVSFFPVRNGSRHGQGRRPA